jgi:DNA polymerase V
LVGLVVVARIFGLVDCNNFFVSCERVFDPKLLHRPVIVLSSNDGCAVSRSAEAKAIGIKMGAPAFKLRDVIDRHNVATLSANFYLYRDMSNRVMATLRAIAPAVAVYSVDEAFIDLSGFDGSCYDFALQIAKTVEQWTGIPVSIGVANTKTLAKVANRIAKRFSDEGVIYIANDEQRRDFLEITQIEDVWGVGRRLSISLRAIGIGNALQLAEADINAIRKQFSVVLQRTAYELRGVVCYPLQSDHAERQQVIYSRTFGRSVENIHELREAAATYTDRAAGKLRQEQLAATFLSIYIKTNKFAAQEPQYNKSIDVGLPHPTNHTPELIEAAFQGLAQIYQPGFRYKKLGICLFGLIDDAILQGELFDPVDSESNDRERRLMQTIDVINNRFGRGSIKFGSMGIGIEHRKWHTSATMRSPRYTTELAEIPTVMAGIKSGAKADD